MYPPLLQRYRRHPMHNRVKKSLPRYKLYPRDIVETIKRVFHLWFNATITIMNNFEWLFWELNLIKKVFQLEGFKAFKFFIHVQTKMNSDRKKTLVAIIASYYVIKKRRKRLFEKEIKT